MVRHTAAAPAVDVLAGGKAVISGLSNPNEKMLMVPAGSLSVSVAAAGTTTPVIGPVPLDLASGSTTIVYAVGSLADKNLTAVAQTYSGSGSAPSSVNAGSGGLAADPSGVGLGTGLAGFGRCRAPARFRPEPAPVRGLAPLTVTTTSPWRRRRDRAGLAVGAVLVVVSGTVAVRDGDRTAFTAAGTVPSAPAAASPTPRAEPPRPAPAASSRPDLAPRRTGIAAAGIRPDASFVPDRVRVAALGVDAPVVRESVDARWSAGAAGGPAHRRLVGRRRRPRRTPGHGRARRSRGQRAAGSRRAVPAGEGAPGGARRGQRADGDATYVVQARRRFAKDDLPWRDLFRQDVEARLLLVTCGGDFDPATRHYTDNVVVYAVPVATAT